MKTPLSLVVTLGVAALGAVTPPPAAAQPAPQSQAREIVIGATVAERREAARALVPLLKDVKAHAEPGLTVSPGGAPPSPLTGQPSTLFAFTISRRQARVDGRVLEAMDQLLAWNIGGPATGEPEALFDRWLEELAAQATAAMALSGGGLCDVRCVVDRMTRLNETWGNSPRGRGDNRDEALLEALTTVVTGEK
ncbi:MAG: hypothetical protein R2745_00015 [Vicinamibacterales bacterium]